MTNFKFDDTVNCEIAEDGIPLEKGPGFVSSIQVRCSNIIAE